MKEKKRIAILGGGPSGLFMYKRFVDAGRTDLIIDIFEKKKTLGVGMPYSLEGANTEHITNVSGNEIPELVTSIEEWIQTVPKEILDRFAIDPKNFNDYKVLPRLLFGQYLSAQFGLLVQQAKESGILTHIHLESLVTDIIDHPKNERVTVEVAGKDRFDYNHVIVCTGHNWPFQYEGLVAGYFDSPYPPSKLSMKLNHPVAIKGSSLTAIDAIRTLARHNGHFARQKNGMLSYVLGDESQAFKLVMHSRNGMLPAVRFHLEDSHLGKDSVMSHEDVESNRAKNDGFLSLDLVFEKNFKDKIHAKDPGFYARIKDRKIEGFVDLIMDLREHVEPFHLFRAEYIEAEKSIKRKESVYWKEMLAVLSFAMNYPAKYFSAEDMQRLQKVLMPLISIVIAFIPQSSVEELLALHHAGALDIISVGEDSEVKPGKNGGAIYHYRNNKGCKHDPYFETFIDCVGQPHLSYDQLPYKSLLRNGTVSPARLKFQDKSIAMAQLANGDKNVEQDETGNYYLRVPGITINDNFQVIDKYGALNDRIYMMAVPYIGGYNPDYSGLDFSEAASLAIFNVIASANLSRQDGTTLSLQGEMQKRSTSPVSDKEVASWQKAKVVGHEPKLYMLLLGSKAPNRNVEQHDYFFGIANSLKELIPQIKAFWPEAGLSIHVDGWREVNKVEDYEVKVVLKETNPAPSEKKLFFINLGGYQTGKLEEQHYVVLTAQDDRALAVQQAKKTVFFKSNSIKGAGTHIDEKYGIDVDDIYRIEDILSPEQKEKYHLKITSSPGLPDDEVHLGYFKLNKF